MRDPERFTMSGSSAGWICLLAFLALPNCSFDPSGVAPADNLYEGPLPHSSAIFCDIEQVLTRHCATAEDLATGVRLAAAAVALNTGQSSSVVIDESPEARGRCSGEPEAVKFHGAFPEGLPVCLNCAVIGGGATYPTATDACIVKCEDVFSPAGPEVPPDPLVVEYCEARARASANLAAAAPEMCFAGACTEAGMLLPDFADPRRQPEPVAWTDLVGVSAAGNALTRTAATTTMFDAGAASEQWMTRGDAYVEFSADETNLSHVTGLAEIPAACPAPCPDTDPSLADIDFAVSLNFDGQFYVIEGGALVMGPGPNGSFGTYAAGERFRVSLRDNSDGTATVTYSRLTGICTPGSPCPETVFYTHTGLAQYPLRVDASFREVGATTADVDVVRIR